MYPSQVEFLYHILDECNYLLQEYRSNTFNEFISNPRLSRAVCRSLEIIGEASNQVDPDLKAMYPDVAWREMADIRNRIIHGYFGIDYDIVWDTVKTDIPVLKDWIDLIISEEKKKF